MRNARPMWSRRGMLAVFWGGLASLAARTPARGETGADRRRFASEAARMRDQAIATGDQPYGAVIVRDGAIVGYGPSRVVQDANTDAHAERVALWEAMRMLGVDRLPGAVVYATSRPCGACQRALAAAGVARMYVGPDATDAGAPAG